MSNDDSEKTRNSVGETNPYVDSVVRGSEMGIGASRKDSKNGDLKTVEKACRDFRVALEGKEGGVIKKIEKELKKIEADVKSVMSMNIPDAEVLRLAHGQLVDRLKEIQAEYNRLFQSSNEIEFVLQRTVSPETRGDILTRIGDSEAIVTVKHKNGKTYRVEQSTEDPDSVVLFPRDTNSSAFSMKKASLLDRGRIPSFFIDEKKVSQVGKLGGVALFDHDDVEQAPEIDEREYHHVDTSATPVKNIRTGGESGTEKVKKETKSGRRVVDIVPKTKITTRPPQTPPRPPQAGGHKVTREARAPYEIGRTDHDLALNNGILEALRVLGKDAKGLKYVIKSSRGGEVKNVTITRVSEDAVFVRFEHEQGKQRGKVIKIGEQKWNDSMPVLVTDSDSHEQKKNVNVSDAVASTRYDTDGKSTQLESPAVATEVARENGEKFSDAVWGDVKRDKKDLNRIWQTFVSKFASAEDVPEGFAKMYTDLETGLTELLATVEGRQAEEQKKTDRGEPGGYVEGKKFNLLKIEGNQYDTLTKRYNQFARELEDFETSIEKKSDEPLENSESDGTAEFPYIANSSEHVQALQRGDFDAFFTEQDPTGSEQIGKRYDILVSPTDPKERVEVKIVGFLQKEGGVGVVYVGLDGEGNEKGPQKTLSPEEWEARSPVLGTMDDVDFADVRYAPSPGHEASSSVQVEPTLREPVRKPTVRDLVVEDLVAEHLRHPATMEKQPPEDEKAPGTQKEVEREVRHMTATELYQTMIEHREGAEGSHGMVEATDGQGNRFTLREDETMVEPAIIGWPIGRGSKIYESLADFLKRPDVTLYIDGVPLAVTLDEGAQPVESAESERVPGVKENGEPLFLLECVEFSNLCKDQRHKENTAEKSLQEIEILLQFSDLGVKIQKFVDTIDYSVYAANPKLTQIEIEEFKLFKKEFDKIQKELEEFRAKEKESAGVPSSGELLTDVEVEEMKTESNEKWYNRLLKMAGWKLLLLGRSDGTYDDLSNRIVSLHEKYFQFSPPSRVDPSKLTPERAREYLVLKREYEELEKEVQDVLIPAERGGAGEPVAPATVPISVVASEGGPAGSQDELLTPEELAAGEKALRGGQSLGAPAETGNGAAESQDELLTPEELAALSEAFSGRQPHGAPVETGNDAAESLKQRLDDLKDGYGKLLEDIEKSGLSQEKMQEFLDVMAPVALVVESLDDSDHQISEEDVKEYEDYLKLVTEEWGLYKKINSLLAQYPDALVGMSDKYKSILDERIKELDKLESDEAGVRVYMQNTDIQRQRAFLQELQDAISATTDAPPASNPVPAGSESTDSESGLSPLAPEIAESRAKLQQHAEKDLGAVKGVIEKLMIESKESVKEKLFALSHLCNLYISRLYGLLENWELTGAFEELKKDIDRVRSAEDGNIEQEYDELRERYDVLDARFGAFVETVNPSVDADVDRGGIPTPETHDVRDSISKIQSDCNRLLFSVPPTEGVLRDKLDQLWNDIFDSITGDNSELNEDVRRGYEERYEALRAEYEKLPFVLTASDISGGAEFDPEHQKSEEELFDVVSTLLSESHSLYSEINRLSPGEYDDIYHQTRKRLVHEFEDLGSDKSARSTFLRTKFIPEFISFRDTGIILKDIWDKKRSSVLALLRNPANWETTRLNKKFWKKKQIRGYIKNPTELLLSNTSLGFENVTEVNSYIRFLEDSGVVYGEWNKKKQRFESIRLRDYGDSDEPDAVVEASSAENSLEQQGDTANDTDLLKKLTDVETDEHGIDTISAVFAEHGMERLVLSMIQEGDQGFATALADMKTWFSGDSLSPATERWMASLEAKQGIDREIFSQRWEQSIAERVLGSLRYMIMTKIEQSVLIDREYEDALDGKYTLPKDSFKALALRSGYSAIPAIVTGVLATALSGGVVAVVGASAAFVGSFSYGALQLRDTKKNTDVQTYQANLGVARERATDRATRDVQTQLGDKDNIPLLSQMFRSALIAESTTDMDSQEGMSALKELSVASKIKRSWMDMVRGESPDSTEANMATADYVLSALALRNAQQSEQSGFALAGTTRSKGYMKKLVDVFSAGKVADVTGQASTAQEYARITANAVIAGMQGAIIASQGPAEWWAKAFLRFKTSGMVEVGRAGLEQKKMRTNRVERNFRAEVTAELDKYESELAQIGKGEFVRREKKEKILMSVLPVLRYAGDGFETLTQESPDIASRLTAVKTKALHFQEELYNEYLQYENEFEAALFTDRVRRRQEEIVYSYGSTVARQLEKRNLDEADYLGVAGRGLFAGGVSAIGGGVLDSLRSSEIYQQALSALGIGHAPHGSSAVSSQHEAPSSASAPEHTAGVERPSSPQETVPRASAGTMPEHAEVREPADAPLSDEAEASRVRVAARIQELRERSNQAQRVPGHPESAPANRPARVAEAVPPANNAPAQQSRAPIVERAVPVQESAPKVHAHAPEIKVPETEKTISTHIVPKKGGTFLGGARTLEKSLSPDDIARLRAEHPEWGTKKVDILKQWRIEQAEKNGQWFDSKAEHFKTRIHPGAEMRLEKGSDGYPRIVLGDDHVEHLDNELVKARGAQTTPPEQGAKVFPVREGGADGKISPAERSVLDARAVQRNADTTLTVGEKSGSVTIPDVPLSKASPSVDVLPGAGGTKASADTTLTVGEESGVSAEKVAASASAAPDTQNAERVSHIVDRLTTDKYILADARTRAVTMKQGSVPLETFANDYVQARPEFDPKDPKDMFDFYQAWRQKSVEYITGGRGNGGGSIPDASRTSQKSLEPVVPKSETTPPTPSPASGERELPDVRVNKDIPIVLHQGLGDDMRQHVSVWDAGENKAVDIGIKQELRPQVRGGHLVLEISGQRTEGELIQHMVDGKKQWALKVPLPQLGRNEYYNLDNLNKGNVEPTVENR